MNRWFRRSALLAFLALALASHFLGTAPESVRASAVPPAPEAPNAPQAGGEVAVLSVRAVGADLRLDDGALVIPVAGIEREDLRDTWGAARGGGRRHAAIDILAPRGTPALAAVEGTIVKLFESKAGGLTMYLADRERRYLYYYAHLDAYAAGVAEGARVKPGTVIGYVGTTGNAPPDAPHLHFSVELMPPGGEWWKGIPENPYAVLTERGMTVRP